jgi:hypothetical protein
MKFKIKVDFRKYWDLFSSETMCKHIKSRHDLKANPSTRCIQCSHVMSAMLKTGTDKIHNGFGNGDCILADLGRNLYAVSDATERFPWGSRSLLARLATQFLFHDGLNWPSRLQTAIEKARASQPYLHKATLSAINIHKRGNSLHCAIYHGGDSRIVILKTSDGSIQYQSKADMNFAGRSQRLPILTLLELTDPRTRIFLVTDGFQDFMHFLATGPDPRLPEILWRLPVHEVSAFIENLIASQTDQTAYDDIGCLILEPFQDSIDLPCLIMGGTRPDQERSFQSTATALQDQWIGHEEWPDYIDQLSAAGILIHPE